MDTIVRFLGTGDAFSSGGRLQACILLARGTDRILLDCGATCLVGMHRYDVDPNDVSVILLSHLHGDHFAGLPFLLLDAQYSRERKAQLIVAGPSGTRRRLDALMEAMYPGSSTTRWRFPLKILELDAGHAAKVGPVYVTPTEVEHASHDTAFALRVQLGPTVVGYTGDTAWTDSLVPVAHSADLFISEAFSLEAEGNGHLDVRSLASHMDDLSPRRLVLTHVGPRTLAAAATLPFEQASDGMTIHL